LNFISSLIEVVLVKTVDFISALGYMGIVVGMAIESANIPLPSEVIMPFGGYLVSVGKLQFVWVALAGTIGGTFGSIVSYFLGLWGGRPFLMRYGKYIGITPKHLLLAERWFERYGDSTVFFTRLMPFIRTFISLPAGISRMNFFYFVIYTFLGSLPWCFFLAYLGVKLGQHWQDLEYWFHRFDVVILAIIVIVAVYFWIKKKKNV